MTEASRQALQILRTTDNFQWHVIPIFLIILYIYGNEAERGNYSVVLASLALWGMDFFNEIWNALVLHFTDYSAVWTAPKGTSFLIFVGLNIEICLMFSVMGLFVVKLLPKDKSMKILGIPNRLFLIILNSLLCVFVEILLNAAGALVWAYSWWNFPMVPLIFLIGYAPFMAVAFWVHDMEKISSKVKVVAFIFAFDILAILVFGVGLRWI